MDIFGGRHIILPTTLYLFCCHHWQSPSWTTWFFCGGFLAGRFLTLAVTASFWREQLPKSSGSVFMIDQAVTPLQHDFQSCSRKLHIQCVSLAFLTQRFCKSFYFTFFLLSGFCCLQQNPDPHSQCYIPVYVYFSLF